MGPGASVFRMSRSSVPCSKSSFDFGSAMPSLSPGCGWQLALRPVDNRPVVEPRVVSEIARHEVGDRGTQADHAVGHDRLPGCHTRRAEPGLEFRRWKKPPILADERI